MLKFHKESDFHLPQSQNCLLGMMAILFTALLLDHVFTQLDIFFISDSDSEDDTYPTSASKRLSHHAECFSTWRTAFDVWGFTKVAVGPNGEIAISGKHVCTNFQVTYSVNWDKMWNIRLLPCMIVPGKRK